MEIPPHLLNQVQQGQVVLFLGAGASKGARNNQKEEPPDGATLARLIADKFLGGEHRDSPLHVVGELAVSESGLVGVQEYVRELFEPYRPADFHLLLPTFRWFGLATTNFDLVTESSYQRQSNRAQRLVPIIKNSSIIQKHVRSASDVVLLKLHGCISLTTDKDTPLILTPDQYAKYRKGRHRLFEALESWAVENPLVFVGSGLQDPDTRIVLVELSESKLPRPRYYIVSSSLSSTETRLWESKNFAVLHGTFQEFLETLDAKLPANVRGVVPLQVTGHPVQAKIAGKVPPSTALLNFLEHDVDYIHAGLATEQIRPQAFYRGFNPGWSAIRMNLDARRSVVDTLLSEIVLVEDTDRPAATDFYVLKGYAGSGKTVALRRIAWEAATDWNRLVIFARPYGLLEFEQLTELSELTKERIFLFVDNAADSPGELEHILRQARRVKLRLTVITAERVNEWNMSCESLDPHVSKTYEIAYLSTSEIGTLVDLLARHNALGHIQGLSKNDQIAEFEERAGRQVLVALYEVTEGRRFEDILVDEYHEIEPIDARQLYLSVCVLNRLGVPVRAGLISRLHQIPFALFRERLFKPLEHVVLTQFDPIMKDYLYSSRHPQIAEIVFQRILKTPQERFDEYSRILSHLNLLFGTDRSAYRRLVRGRVFLELFPDHQMVVQLFGLAERVGADDAHIYHQKAIYEMRRPSGNLQTAHDLLSKALSVAEHDVSVVHSMAELELMRSERAQSMSERERLRGEAKKLAMSIRDHPTSGPYAYHTLLKVSLQQLRDVLTSDSSDAAIDSQIREVEQFLSSGLQKFPDDPFLLAEEASFRELMRDQSRAMEALQQAFSANNRSPFVARRLARAYEDRGAPEKALEVLRSAIGANPGDRSLHFAYAMMLSQSDGTNIDTLLYHLKRGFTPGDQNFEAQFWYAAYMFLGGEPERLKESVSLFASLRTALVPHDMKVRVRHVIRKEGAPVAFSGRLTRKEPTYGFIRRDGMGDSIFVHRDDVHGDWGVYRTDDRIAFEIGLTFSGPVAINARRLQ